MLAFDEADAAIYFGRDDDIRRLIERLNARRAQGGAKLVAVLGASGSGKSSLLRAGVLPRLKRDTRNWIALPPFRPQLHPLEELAQAVAIGLGPGADWRHWRQAFTAPDITQVLSDLARDLRAAHRANEAQILITIDQAEELLGAAEKTEAEQFLRAINGLLDERLPFLVVMALRSDYLGQLQQAPALTASFEEFSLKPMPLTRVRDIIEGPAHVAGLMVEDALVMAAMNDAATDDALPLLAFALRELYDRFGQSRRLTVEAYRALGDDAAQLSPLENAVRRRAEEVLSAAKPGLEDLQALKEAFVPAMVRVNADGEYVRRPARFDALPWKARPLVERLAKVRLLIIRQDRDAAIVEVTHEALMRKWPLLRGWLDEEREFLIGKDQLELDLRDWEKAPVEQKTEALLSGLKLTRARTWLVAKPQQLSEAERNFIQASIAHREGELTRRERFRRRVQRGTVAAALVLAIVATGALWEWREAKTLAARSESRRLAATALLLRDDDLELSSLLSIESARTADTFESSNALLTMLETNPRFLTSIHYPSWPESVVFSPDGKTLASANKDKTVRLWDVATRQPLGEPLTGHIGGVTSVAFSPDGKTLASASEDETVRLWNVATRKPLGEPLAGHTRELTSVAFSPDGKMLASGSWDETVRLWDVATRQPLGAPLTGHNDGVLSVVFSPDGKMLASGGWDRKVRLWNVATRQPLGAPLTGHNGAVESVAFSPDGKMLASGSRDYTVRLWDVANRQPLGDPLTGHSNTVESVAFSPDGKMLASASEDQTVRLWDVATRQPLGAPLTGHNGGVTSVVFNPDDKTLASANTDNTVRLWDVANRQPLGAALTGQSRGLTNVAFSPDGQTLASASYDQTVRLWDVATRQPLGAPLTGHNGAVESVAFSPDGKMLASGSNDDTVRLWDVATRQPLGAPLTGHSDAVRSVAFSPDGKTLASASEDETVRLWNVATRKPLGEPLAGHSEMVTRVVFSPDGKTLASASRDSTVRLWDVANRQPLGEPLASHRDWVTSVVFSPDGKMLASGSWDKTVRLWNVATRQPLGEPLTGHREAVESVAFSPDGKLLASASSDKTVRLWDVATRKPLGEPLTGHSDEVRSVAFSPDGKMLASASDDKTVRLWDVDPKSWASRACERANRNMSLAEWQHYLGNTVAYHRTCPDLPYGEGAPGNPK